MRVIGEIPHPQLKITLFNWNGKYLIKLEAGPYEQTYKVSETDVSGEDDIRKLVNETFIAGAMETFKAMHLNLSKAMEIL
jgi:hypothetical protein